MSESMDRFPKISSPVHVGYSEAKYEIWLLSTSRIAVDDGIYFFH